MREMKHNSVGMTTDKAEAGTGITLTLMHRLKKVFILDC